MHSILSDLKLVFRQLRKSPDSQQPRCSCWPSASAPPPPSSLSSTEFSCARCPFPDADRLVTLGDQVSGTNWGQHDSGPGHRSRGRHLSARHPLVRKPRRLWL